MNFYDEIRIRYGNIKRARGFYVYTEKNIRLLDLYLDEGMSLLGRKESQIPLVLKQYTDKGLYSFFPTSADYNLQKALHTLFPEHTEIAFYYDCQQVLDWFERKTGKKDFSENLWKPFLSSSEALKKQLGFFVQPPFCTSVKIAVFKKTAAAEIPKSGNITALEKAALAKAFFKLIKFIELYKCAKLKPAAKQYGTAKKLCSEFWNIENMYLFPKIKKTDYEDFFKAALDAHILISPDFTIPSILPNINVYTELINFLKIQKMLHIEKSD